MVLPNYPYLRRLAVSAIWRSEIAKVKLGNPVLMLGTGTMAQVVTPNVGVKSAPVRRRLLNDLLCVCYCPLAMANLMIWATDSGVMPRSLQYFVLSQAETDF